LRVTEIETWLRDPYAIYARHVLGLKPLDPLDAEPGPAERGTAIHKALERFLRDHSGPLPPDAMERLIGYGEDAFAHAGASSAALALWRPRFARAAQWFITHERERRSGIAGSAVEIKGALDIAAPGGVFVLSGRADRIDLYPGGAGAIVDYKTGRVPSDKQIETLLAPQLPLEGAMLLADALEGVRAETLRAFVHIQLGGGEPPGKEIVSNVDAGAKAQEALERLTARILRYDQPDQPYLSRQMPFKLSEVRDYDHLARVREWLRAGDDEGGE
jgi:ATP-dependent helicase/nuclease subunit B